MVRETQHNIDEFVSFANEILQHAGSIAMQHYGKGREGTRFDEDLLTKAELKINEYFEATLTARYPEHRIFWNDRQQTEYSHGENRYLWVFDSIDGADNFQAGIPIWGTSLALLENFWPVLGMFLMPATGDFFHARAGGSAYRGEQQIHLSQRETIDNESLLFTYSRFHHHYKSHFPGKHRDLGCAAAHVCYIAMGRGDAAVISNESFQGLAAARTLIEAAGGKIMKMDGADFFLNEYLDGRKIGNHLLVTSPAKLDAITGCLRRNRNR